MHEVNQDSRLYNVIRKPSYQLIIICVQIEIHKTTKSGKGPLRMAALFCYSSRRGTRRLLE